VNVSDSAIKEEAEKQRDLAVQAIVEEQERLARAHGKLATSAHRLCGKDLAPSTGAVLRTIESNRFVTGVSFVDGELWHGTWEGDESELRHVDAESGAVLERLTMPAGTNVSGLESDGADLFYAGGGPTGKVRAVRRPAKRAKR